MEGPGGESDSNDDSENDEARSFRPAALNVAGNAQLREGSDHGGEEVHGGEAIQGGEVVQGGEEGQDQSGHGINTLLYFRKIYSYKIKKISNLRRFSRVRRIR